MVATFHGPDKKAPDAYQSWRRAHPDGFVMSEGSKGLFTLHWAQDLREHGGGRGCNHLGGNRNPYRADKHHCYTTKRKVCSESTAEQATWAQENHYTLKSCFHCNSRKFPFPSSPSVSLAPDAQHNFEVLVAASRNLSSSERRKLLAVAGKKPTQISVITTIFQRNPHVVAEVLHRAKGVCEECNEPAPFKGARTGNPYLEVHHRTRLADDGDDTVDNAIALCPNCHRKAHYG